MKEVTASRRSVHSSRKVLAEGIHKNERLGAFCTVLGLRLRALWLKMLKACVPDGIDGIASIHRIPPFNGPYREYAMT